MAETTELDSFFGVGRRKQQATALLAKINRPTVGVSVSSGERRESACAGPTGRDARARVTGAHW